MFTLVYVSKEFQATASFFNEFSFRSSKKFGEHYITGNSEIVQPRQSTFPIFHNFLPNYGRIPPALTYNGSQPLNVNAGRILPGFGRK